MEVQKRLIPLRISSCGENRYSVKIDENDPFEVEADEKSIRKAIYRIKAKDGDGKKSKRSSKNGTYLNMIDREIYCWKSKCPADAESFKALLENVCNDVITTRKYIIEGHFIPENTYIRITECAE